MCEDVWPLHTESWRIRQGTGGRTAGIREAAQERRETAHQRVARLPWQVDIPIPSRRLLHLAAHLRQNRRGLGLPRSPRHHHGDY